MARKLKTYVYLNNPDSPGDAIGFGPDDDLPDWAVSQIDDYAFEDVPDKPAPKTVRHTAK